MVKIVAAWLEWQSMKKLPDPRALKGITLTLFFLALLQLAASSQGSHKRYWLNLSDSVPMGLYRLEKFHGEAKLGELVVMNVPHQSLPYIYGRGWLPEGWMLFKQVGGIPGDTVCVFDFYFTINGMEQGPVYSTDHEGLLLPRLRGCRKVPAGHFFPVATGKENSFDGRYMGPVEVSAIAGVANPLFTVP